MGFNTMTMLPARKKTELWKGGFRSEEDAVDQAADRVRVEDEKTPEDQKRNLMTPRTR